MNLAMLNLSPVGIESKLIKKAIKKCNEIDKYDNLFLVSLDKSHVELEMFENEIRVIAKCTDVLSDNIELIVNNL